MLLMSLRHILMLTNLRSERFSPVFSSRSFIVLSCTYRPMIHFEGWLFWVYTVRYWLKFVFSAYGCSIVVAVGKKKKKMQSKFT